jgi:TP901 family phage tail tape measure protein
MSVNVLQTLVVRLTLNSMQYQAGMINAMGMANTFASQTAAAATNLTRNLTLPLTIMGAVAVREYARFNRAMTESLSIMGNVTDEMKGRMAEQARVLGRTTVTSADQLAKSYYYLAQTGMSAANAIESLSTVNNFAIAGMFDNAKATDLLTDAQKALGMSISDDAVANAANLKNIGDTLVKASTLANASVEQFSTSLTTKAAAAMRFFNVSMSEGVAVLATYSDMGKKGADAGNLYDRALRLLAKSAISNAYAHKELGFAVYDAQGKMRHMADIIDNLDDIMTGLSPEMRSATLAILGFEARSQQAITPLLGMGDAIRRLHGELINVTGYTDEVAMKVQESFSAQMTILWNQIKVMAEGIGSQLVPAIKLATSAIEGMVYGWEQTNSTVRAVIVGFGVFLGLLGPAAGAAAAFMLSVVALNNVIIAMMHGSILAAIAVRALQFTFVGFVAFVAGVAVYALYQWLSGWNEVNAAMAENERMQQKLMDIQQLRMNKEVEKLDKIGDKRQKLKELEFAIADAEKNIRGKEAGVRGMEAMVNENEALPWHNPKAWAASNEVDKQVMAQQRQQLEGFRRHKDRLVNEKEKLEAEMAAKPKENVAQALERLGVGKGLGASMMPKAFKDFIRDRAKAMAKDDGTTWIDKMTQTVQKMKEAHWHIVKAGNNAVFDAKIWLRHRMTALIEVEKKEKEKAQKEAERAQKEADRARERLQEEIRNNRLGDAMDARSGFGALLDKAGGGMYFKAQQWQQQESRMALKEKRESREMVLVTPEEQALRLAAKEERAEKAYDRNTKILEEQNAMWIREIQILEDIKRESRLQVMEAELGL